MLENSSIEFENLVKLSSFKTDYDVLSSLSHEGLKKEDYIEICKRLERAPNRTELGMFGVMWSEHCCYRNSKPLLQNLPTSGKRILVGPGENAGVVDIGDGQRIAFKIESHNHPSAVEPFQGAATGVGGILRDIFTMGARPIALLNALRFGLLEDKKNVGLLEGVVAGIAHYGNCVGVPTIGGETSFNTSYSGNPLVNAMAIGLLETKDIVCSGAKGIDYPVIYVGSTTGRDGMGGASFASAELSNTSLDDRPAVQVGDPFLEKGLIEGCLEAFKTGNVIAAQDMGAAGLTCSCSEMAAKGEVGIELDLDLVPAREQGMTPYEFLLSESQERMLFVVKPGKENDVMKIFTNWGLKAQVVGKVLKERVVRVLYQKKIVVDLPADALAEDTPVNEHSLLSNPPKYILDHWKWTEENLPFSNEKGITVQDKIKKDRFFTWNNILLKLLDDPTIASKKWIYNQYDYQVQNNTIIPPGAADAAVIRVRDIDSKKSDKLINKGLAAVVDCPNRWVALDPERGAIAAVAEASRNISCVGGEPLALTDNLNFSSPDHAIGYWQLAKACEGISKASLHLDTPVTGGNVSLYNEIRLSTGEIQPIQPTPVIGMIGLIDDINTIVGQSWINEGDLIWLLGVPLEASSLLDNRISLSCTAYLENIFNLHTGRPPEIDLNLEKLIQSFLRKSISNQLILSAHDVSDGGIATALAESVISSGLGAKCIFPNTSNRIDSLLFAEGGSRIVISISPSKLSEWKLNLRTFARENSFSIPAMQIGHVQRDPSLSISQANVELIQLSISQLASSFNNAIPRRMS
ncbi:phosphoribosylformylglycinamidine synthase subunit PurL [Prochlorococcus marinus]|uniref:Phosphoribosylformylglycinamidine synthase subunit PurL n=1 Tax=Prochlorococcus marinus (strain MIT 9211) TaxID=93059 RepID=A9B9K0_PROM4|nr:phosphoribosylformylglycinamidine synthase subunit PurL [Prochlorococcus marinus]ABX07933.1 phosphoribosylformylglycinamidine synthetase II [Prochlorococcus marinus str. MIT 9211]